MRIAASAPSKPNGSASTGIPSPPGGERELIPLSALNQFLFCPRRATLIHIEGIFKDNEHTLRGDIVHDHADLPGYEIVKGVTLLRALPVWSNHLGLIGKCDLVEQHLDGTLIPVEFKLGKRRRWVNDDVQVCAQALCLEEMFAIHIPQGAIFHASSKCRREISLDATLRDQTLTALQALRDLIQTQTIPAAEYRPACEECSLYEICQPRLSAHAARVRRLALENLQPSS